MVEKVQKPFNTVNRRFKAGDEVTPGDVEGDVLSFEMRQSRGFISGNVPAPPPRLAGRVMNDSEAS